MKLTPNDKELIVAEVRAKTATMKHLAARYGVSQGRISQVIKNMTGSALHSRIGRGNQETNPVQQNATQAISLKDVLEAVAQLYEANPHDPFYDRDKPERPNCLNTLVTIKPSAA